MRRTGLLVAFAMGGALVAVAPAAAQPTPQATAFCDANLAVDKAANKALGTERPKRKDVQALESAVTRVESTAPPEMTANVQAAASAVRTGLQNRQDPTDDPNFEPNLRAINEYRYNSCGYTQLDVTGIEYQFQGLPGSVPTGPVAIRFTDAGAEVHELVIGRLKSKDSLKKILGSPEKEQANKIEFLAGTNVAQGQTNYVIADLNKPGRYGVVCFLPVGSTSLEAAEAAERERGATPHWREGMLATITAERGG
jgi:hypothetical protein